MASRTQQSLHHHRIQANCIVVGSIVRIPIPSTLNTTATTATSKQNKKRAGLGTVLTIDETEALILLQDRCCHGPNSLPNPIFTPSVHDSSSKQQISEEEIIVPLTDIQPLMEFEYDRDKSWFQTTHTSSTTKQHVENLKSHGDTLLRHCDPSSAIAFYEEGLNQWKLHERIQIGGTVLIPFAQVQNSSKQPPPSQATTIVRAEIDCIDDDNLDVTIVVKDMNHAFNLSSSTPTKTIERVISRSQIILPIPPTFPDAELQVRVLLNLSRCFLQLVAELEDPYSPYSRQLGSTAKYRHATIQVTTATLQILDMIVTEYHPLPQHKQQEEEEEDGNITSNNSNNNSGKGQQLQKLVASAFYLRSKAYAGLCQWNDAKKDAILYQLLEEPDATKWISQLQHMEAKYHASNKKLVKSMCRWIQTATTQQKEQQQGEKEEESDSTKHTKAQIPTVSTIPNIQETRRQSSQASQLTIDGFVFEHLCSILVVLIALLLFSYTSSSSFRL